MFIEIPIYTRVDSDDIDYESLNIPAPDEDEDAIEITPSLVNLDHIERINAIEGRNYKTVLHNIDGTCLRSPLDYNQIKIAPLWKPQLKQTTDG